MIKLIGWILKHFDPVANDRWTLEQNYKMVRMFRNHYKIINIKHK
jgi:hypothetical protein